MSRRVGPIQGGVNCSVPDIINTLGGGPAVFKTLTTMVGNCGGVTSYLCKTLTTMVGNCGGITSYICKNTYHHDQGGANCFVTKVMQLFIVS